MSTLSDNSITILRELENDFSIPLRRMVRSSSHPDIMIDRAYDLIKSAVEEDEQPEVAKRFRRSISSMSTRAWWWTSWLNDNWGAWIDLFNLERS